MKKFFALTMTVVMLLSSWKVTAFAETNLATSVYVTISDKDGKLALAQEKITVTDVDNDGTLTINDALYAAHEAKYEGGAAAGYASSMGQYGMQLDKLWGTSNGGSYGYYVNNASAMGLGDTVKEGDYINAFIYTDLTSWSDTYCYFDMNAVAGETGTEISLRLSAAGFDGNWNPIELPVEGATITVNGEKTEVKTDAEGKANIKIENGGNYIISATSDTQVLVPPVCMATVATNATAKVYVTISDKDGKLALTQEEITVSDVDKDGSLTINDTLFAAHEAKYEGGAAAGYESAYGAYGLSLNKLWGTSNGGSYGYYVNNQSAWSLADTVEEGDYINAFVYTDLTSWSDTYCYFDVNTTKSTAGKEFSLTLSMAAYDASYNPITVPVEGATITVNGEKTEFKTDKDGKVTIKIEAEGSYVISAVSDTMTLVPAVCNASIDKAVVPPTPDTGDNANVMVYVMLLAASLSGIAMILYKDKKSYEK